VDERVLCPETHPHGVVGLKPQRPPQADGWEFLRFCRRDSPQEAHGAVCRRHRGVIPRDLDRVQWVEWQFGDLAIGRLDSDSGRLAANAKHSAPCARRQATQAGGSWQKTEEQVAVGSRQLAVGNVKWKTDDEKPGNGTEGRGREMMAIGRFVNWAIEEERKTAGEEARGRAGRLVNSSMSR